MQKYVKPFFEETELGISPFLNKEFKINVRRGIDLRTFKKVDMQEKPNEYVYDAGLISKIFIDSEYRLISSGLKSYSQRLLIWILYELDNGKDWLWINKVRYMEENHLKDMRVYRNAIKDLVKYSFLAVSTITDVYWINPHMFFRGSRVEKYKDKLNVVK